MIEKVQAELEAALAAMERREVVPHDWEQQADASSVAFAKRFQLVQGQKALQRVAGIRSGSCAAHTYPQADSKVVDFGAKLITWLFLFDDAVGEGAEVNDAR